MVSRAGTRRCYVYISLLCVGVKKQRKISSESERAFEKNLRFFSNATCTTNSNDREFEEKEIQER